MSETQQMGLFAKYWEPGKVKTRLAESIGRAAAADIFQQFVMTLLRRFANTPAQLVLSYTPGQRRDQFSAAAPTPWQVREQGSGMLGNRMRRFFGEAFAAGKERVVLIGADSPNMPIARVTSAFELLRDHDVVLGPATDGGYYLIGIRSAVTNQLLEQLFSDMAWGTDQVWPVTVARLRSSAVPWAQLEKWYDVDTMADLQRLLKDLDDEPSELALVQLANDLRRVLSSPYCAVVLEPSEEPPIRAP